MGIPSYYKKLRQFARRSIDIKVESVWFDFNCLIYDCLRRPGITESYNNESRIDWEAFFIEEIVKYVKEIIEKAYSGSKGRRNVYIAIDGVVPMAKIRQQRLRRFRSAWQKDGDFSAWDTNAITPGTEFMEKLGSRLKKESWKFSGADEPGEGEQKVMAELRGRKTYDGAIVIYGLDADLILLSILQSLRCKQPIYLMREERESGCEPIISYLPIDDLKDVLGNSSSNSEKFLLDYIFCMSLMGNDFLPHSMSMTLKEKGHEFFLSILQDFIKDSGNIIEGELDNYSVDHVKLQKLMSIIAAKEEEFLVKKIRSKFLLNRTGDELKVGRVEQVLLDSTKKWTLKKDWQNIYYDSWFSGADVKDLVSEYWTGFDWILNYYTGQAKISFDWYYPWNLPPLWSDLCKGVGNDDWKWTNDERILKPQEQLAIVLPLESWWLVRDANLRRLPEKCPAFFPEKDSTLFTAGRTWFWECLVEIPIFSSKRLRRVL